MLAERLLGALAEPVEVDGEQISARRSLGAAIYPRRRGPEQLTQNADRALYHAKRLGGAQVKFFGLIEG